MATDLGHQQRDVVKQISPPWLSGGVAERILYTIGLSSDLLLEKLNQAITARLPGRGDASALPYLGNDRVMAQGPNEANAAFASRLKRAFDTWQRAGSNRSILQQVLGYVSTPTTYAGQVPIGTVVTSTPGGTYSAWDTYYNTSQLGGPPARLRTAPANWNWDGLYTNESAYLVLYFTAAPGVSGAAASIGAPVNGFSAVTGLSGVPTTAATRVLTITGAATSANNGVFTIASVVSPTSVVIANPSAVSDVNNGSLAWVVGSYPSIGPAPAWGTPGLTWGGANVATMAWGCNQSSGYVAGLRSLVRTWKSAHTSFPWIVFAFGGGTGIPGSEFSPLSSIGAGNPDGNWATWAKTVGAQSVPARTTGLNKFSVVCDGVAIYQQSYVPTGT